MYLNRSPTTYLRSPGQVTYFFEPEVSFFIKRVLYLSHRAVVRCSEDDLHKASGIVPDTDCVLK